jgi:hypothetical protein
VNALLTRRIRLAASVMIDCLGFEAVAAKTPDCV